MSRQQVRTRGSARKAAENGPLPRLVAIAVIGLGRIGSMHAELLAHSVNSAALAGVYDVADELVKAVASRLNAREYVSVDEALEDPRVDAIAICSSTETHVPMITEAAAAGKAIFCEKPISLDLDEGDLALGAVSKGKVLLHVGFNRRFDPAHAAVRGAVAEGLIGKPEIVRISSRDPAPPPREYLDRCGGIFLDMMIHDFDMARFVTGSEIVEVFAKASATAKPADADTADTAVVTLRHENGCLTVIDNSRRAVYGYDQRVEVLGSGGAMRSDNRSRHSAVLANAVGEHTASLDGDFQTRYRQSYIDQWESFTKAVSASGMAAVTGVDARAAAIAAIAARRSLSEGRPIAFDEVGM